MADEIYWIWLQEALGIGSVKVDKVIEAVGSAKDFYELDQTALQETGFLTQEEIARIRVASLDNAKRKFERAKRLECEVVTPDHPDYPPYFTHIHCKPCVLYVLGGLSAPAPVSITVVGTRNCDEDGLSASFQLSRDLAAAGFQIVSGLAAGIDRAAHQGALSVHGRTVGFLACGINVDYPRENNQLKRQILNEGGALASEFPFDTEAWPGNFHIRNRLMSGISDGTLVIQAPEKSGALITARHALDQNRDVFAVPGGIFDKKMVGCNRLIRDGSSVVLNVYSILDVYLNRFTELERKRMGQEIRKVSGIEPDSDKRCAGLPRKRKAAQKPRPEKQVGAEKLEEAGVSQAARKIYAALGNNESVDCDTMVSRTELPVSAVVSALTELEMFDLITAEPGRRYHR